MRQFDLAFSPGGNLLEMASEDHHVMPWEVTSARMHWTFHGHPAPVTRAVFSPGGRVLSSASAE